MFKNLHSETVKVGILMGLLTLTGNIEAQKLVTESSFKNSSSPFIIKKSITNTNEESPNCNNADPGSSSGDLGCATFVYHGESVTYTTVRGNDGKIWLQQNLGSSKVATSITDSDAYGDLFQWGRWDDGHQLRNSTISAIAPTPNNPLGLSGGNATFYSAGYNSSSNWWYDGTSEDRWSGENSANATSTIGVDPCKAIGSGWRLPTVEEVDNMLIAENISEYNSALDSNLKLVPAGMKDYYEGIYAAGTNLYLWSSSPSPYSGSGQHLYISQYSALTNSGSRQGGMSVRCTKDVTGDLGTAISRKPLVGLYPNPTKGIVNVQVDNKIEAINMINMAGQKEKLNGFSNNQIDMKGLPNGVYVIEVVFSNGMSVFKRIIKN